MIYRIEVHKYAPELNKIHMTDGSIINAPQIKTIKEAERFLNEK